MRLLAALMVFLTFGPPLGAEPFGQASIEDTGAIVPGQQVHVVVDVFAPEFFTSPPQYPLFEVADALVTLSNDRAQNLVQTIDGVQYSGIRRSYAVVPEQAGSFTLPEIAIEFGFSSRGTPVKTTVKVALPAFVVAVKARSAATSFAARNLTISQSFDRDPVSLKVGDALVRTIVVLAEDTQAMLIPPVQFGRGDKVTLYVKPPVLADGVELRGFGRSVETGSTRTQAVTYTVSEGGRFSLPSVSYPWFDIDGQALSIATLPAVDVVVAKAAATERIQPVIQEETKGANRLATGHWLLSLLLTALALAAFGLGWMHYAALQTWVRALRERYRNSLRERLRRVRSSIRHLDEPAIYRALEEWSSSLGYRSVSDWVKAQASPTLTTQVANLARRLFRSRDVELDRIALAAAIVPPDHERRIAKKALPPLNPTAQEPLLPPL